MLISCPLPKVYGGAPFSKPALSSFGIQPDTCIYQNQEGGCRYHHIIADKFKNCLVTSQSKGIPEVWNVIYVRYGECVKIMLISLGYKRVLTVWLFIELNQISPFLWKPLSSWPIFTNCPHKDLSVGVNVQIWAYCACLDIDDPRNSRDLFTLIALLKRISFWISPQTIENWSWYICVY